MNPIAMFFGLILLAVSVFYVAIPLRAQAPAKKSTGRGVVSNEKGMPSSEKHRQAVLLAIRDLDFDYRAGKVTEEDYQALRVSLVNDAAQLMQIQEQQKEDSIEALIQSRRLARPTAKVNGTVGKLCQHCQAPLPAGAKFCSKCGTPVGENVCPKCKQSLHAGDRFCPSCGTAISSEKQSNVSSGRGKQDEPEY